MKNTLTTLLAVCASLTIGATETTLAQPPPTNGLVAYFPFNGNANDESGNGNHGQINGALLSPGIDGAPNTAFLFSQQPLRNITGTGINLANSSLTVSFWLLKQRREGEASTQQGYTLSLGDQDRFDQSGKVLHFTLIDGGQTISFDFFNDALTVPHPGLGESNWVHIVGTYDTNTHVRNLYIDGQLRGSNSSTGFSGADNFVFQAHDSQVVQDEIRFYNRALTEAEVQSLFRAERPICSPHRARATAIVDNGIVTGAIMKDFGCGYTNEPVVLIRGGGGTGAGAYATIEDGHVSSIVITNGGCCYASMPRIEIASPPFEPSLTIEVNTVRLIQKVVLGRKYVIQSSENLRTWIPVSDAFVAESESITNEFPVTTPHRQFRIQEVR